MDKTRVGAAGGSCGVDQAVRLARRHADVRSLVLLAGGLDAEGLTFVTQTGWLPIFAAAAADDQYDDDAPGLMQWILAMSGNPRNKFSGFKDGKHGTEIFGPHPELPKQIVAWYDDTLVKRPADPKAAVKVKNTLPRQFWEKAVTPAGVSAAVQMFYETRERNPRAVLFPEAQLNQLGYTAPASRQGHARHPAIHSEQDGVPVVGERLRQPGRCLPRERSERAGTARLGKGDRAARQGSLGRGPEEGDSRERRTEDREAQRKPEGLGKHYLPRRAPLSTSARLYWQPTR